MFNLIRNVYIDALMIYTDRLIQNKNDENTFLHRVSLGISFILYAFLYYD